MGHPNNSEGCACGAALGEPQVLRLRSTALRSAQDDISVGVTFVGHPGMLELLHRIESQHEAVERPGGRLLLRTRFRRHEAGNAVIDDQLSVVFS